MSTLRKNTHLFDLKTLAEVEEFNQQLARNMQDDSPKQVSRIRQAFALFVIALALSSCAGVLAPMPHLENVPGKIEQIVWTLSCGSALLTLMWIWFTKPGHQWLIESSERKITKQAFNFFGMPIGVGLVVAFLSFGAVSGLTGLFISQVGIQDVKYGVLLSKSYTTRRGCKFQTFVQWKAQQGKSEECVSEAWFNEVKIGEEVQKKHWFYRGLTAESQYIWPVRNLPELTQRDHWRSQWGGFVFIFGMFLFPIFAYLLSGSLLGITTAAGFGAALAWLVFKFL